MSVHDHARPSSHGAEACGQIVVGLAEPATFFRRDDDRQVRWHHEQGRDALAAVLRETLIVRLDPDVLDRDRVDGAEAVARAGRPLSARAGARVSVRLIEQEVGSQRGRG